MESVRRNPYVSPRPRNILADLQRAEEARITETNTISQHRTGSRTRTKENIPALQTISKDKAQPARNVFDGLRRAEGKVAQQPPKKTRPVEPIPLCPRRTMTEGNEVNEGVKRTRNALVNLKLEEGTQMAPQRVAMERSQTDPQGVHQRPRNILADLQYQLDRQATGENVEEEPPATETKQAI